MVMLFTPVARAQCQSWSSQFDSSHIGGNGIQALQVFDDGTGSRLWVGGSFGADPNVGFIGTWDGTQWAPACCLPNATNTGVESLTVHDAGQGPTLYAGFETASGYGCIALWTGQSWVTVGGGLGFGFPLPTYYPFVQALTSYNAGGGAELYLGGGFDGSQTVASKGIIRWDGLHWNTLGSGLAGIAGQRPAVNSLTVYDDGSGPALYVAGSFATAGGITSPWIARWNGTTWSALGSGVNGQVIGMGVWDDGSGAKLYVSGTFTVAGGAPISKVAIWDGASWSAMSQPPLTACYAMLPYDDGRGRALFMGLSATVEGKLTHSVSRWDGSKWPALGGGVSGSFGSVLSMAAYDDGSGRGADLYLGGYFLHTGTDLNQSMLIARWYNCAGTDYICPGDDSLAACPCANYGLPLHGCRNSAHGGGALLKSDGTTHPDTLEFQIADVPPHSLTILFQGDAPTASALHLGDGLQCVGGHLLRLYLDHSTGGVMTMPGPGQPPISMKSASLGDPINPGSVRLYQAYYRDMFTLCGTGLNISNGVRVVWR
jgi:hypothetical protein